MTPENVLISLRHQIRSVDDAILKLVAERQELARKVGEAKLAQKLPIKDYGVEKEVIAKARARGKELGFYEDMAEEIARTLIKYSCWVQEEYQGRARYLAGAKAKRILICGGLGLMGQWLARYFESFGHAVTLHDVVSITGPTPSFPIAGNFTEAAQAADVIVFATPITATVPLIDAAIAAKTKAIVFDICSLKSPLLSAIERARKAGLRYTSIHPMFGPSVQWLAGRNILLCDTGDEAALEEASVLFSESTATLVRIPLALHDELIGYVLGLSHLTNLTFADALSRSQMAYAELKKMGSTTFSTQAAVTDAVVRENQDLYYEIQAENSVTEKVLVAMREALEAYTAAISKPDRQAFKALMEKSRAYFSLS